MKSLQVANFLISLSILILVIYLHSGTESGKDFWSKINLSKENINKLKGTEINFTVAQAVMEKLRDTLSIKLGADYTNLHTGGVRFSYADLKAYMTIIHNDGIAANLTEDSISKLSVYICPGVYPKGFATPVGNRDVSYRLTTILFVPLKGKDIFDPQTHKLNITQNMFLTAYNWGDLEP